MAHDSTARLLASHNNRDNLDTINQNLSTTSSPTFTQIKTQSVKTDTSTPTDFTVVTGADKTLALSTVVYNDIVTSFDTLKAPPANSPTLNVFIGNLHAYNFAVNDYLELSSELLHDYKEGTDIEIHLHWATNGVDTNNRAVKWEVEYSVQNDAYSNGIGSVYTVPIVVSAETVIPANTPTLSGGYTSIGIISGTGLKIGAMIKARLRRITSIGTAPSNAPFAISLGYHYAVDTLGSRMRITK